MMVSAKKGISALQLQRNLGLGSYRTAWFLAHRIREAMRAEPVRGLLKGQVQCDETYVGGKPRHGDGKVHGKGISYKTPVVALVETGGKVRSQPVENVDSSTLLSAMAECIDKDAQIITDEHRAYPPAAAGMRR
jgi:transposase-like protein